MSGDYSAIARDRLRGVDTTVRAVARFRGELARHWRPLALAFTAALGYTATRIAEPWPIKFIFDNVLLGQPLATPLPAVDEALSGQPMWILAASLLSIVVLAVLRGLFYYVQNVTAARVGQEIAMRLRRRLFAHLQRLSLSFHHRSRTGDLLTRLTGDINMLRELLVGSLVSVTSEVVMLLGFLLVMFLLEPVLALVAVIVVPLVFGMLTLYSGQIRDAAHKQRRREGELASRLSEVLSGIHVVQAFAREDEEDERLRALNRRSLKSGLKASRLEAQLNRAVELALAGATAITLGVGSLRVLDGFLTPGELIVFVAYMQSFYRPLRRISRVTERASKATTCLERVTSVLDQGAEVKDGPRTAPAFKGTLNFQQVTFAYLPGRPVLHGIDLHVPAGRTIALVGPSGAGKSTLVSLVPRFFDPTEGRVRIDGYDLRELTLRSLREQVSVVPQDGMLFAATLAENICYGRPEATPKQLAAAVEAAQLGELVERLPDGLQTRVEERGVSLSGGQRQRVAIARALLKDAPILILDEPTSNLDSESEALVMAAFDRLLEGRTALVIAHRLSTIQRADEVVVLDQGRLVERGAPAALLARGGRYRELLAQQAEGRQQHVLAAP